MKKLLIAALCCAGLTGAIAFSANSNVDVKVAGNGGYVNVRV